MHQCCAVLRCVALCFPVLCGFGGKGRCEGPFNVPALLLGAIRLCFAEWQRQHGAACCSCCCRCQQLQCAGQWVCPSLPKCWRQGQVSLLPLQPALQSTYIWAEGGCTPAVPVRATCLFGDCADGSAGKPLGTTGPSLMHSTLIFLFFFNEHEHGPHWAGCCSVRNHRGELPSEALTESQHRSTWFDLQALKDVEKEAQRSSPRLSRADRYNRRRIAGGWLVGAGEDQKAVPVPPACAVAACSNFASEALLAVSAVRK